MSFKYEQRRELLGIGTSSGSGKKRTAEDRGHSSIYDIQDGASWKREKPTRIQTASTAAQESNPFDNKRVRANADSLSRPSGSNPTARRIVTEHSSQGPKKRPRTETEGFNGLGDKYPEKYGGSDERQRNPPLRELGTRAIPSFVQKRSTGDPPLTGQVKSKFYPGSRSKQTSTLTSQRKVASTSSIINIDASDPDDDKDKDTVEPQPKPLTKTSSHDEIDFIEHTSGEASQRSVSGASGWFDKPHSEQEEFHESDLFRQTRKSSSLLGSATRPKRPRNLPPDGTSTKQLIERHRVSGIVNQINGKHQPRHYADLKQAGSKLGRMKGKTASSSKRTTGVTSRIGVISRDKLATASTPYTCLSSGVVKGNAKEATKDRKETGEEPPSNLDEIILAYPPSGQGAVNITIGDLRRLEPSEFLNDTIIEFGLKLWLNDLRQGQPELADCIHVFSPFFFKKLVSKSNKTPEDGHKSVRKWTAKVDIFKKKYIIVPINENIHWYLAIIYHPEHILEPAPSNPRLRTSKRLSDAVPTNQLRETTGLDTDAILVNGSTSRRDKDGGEVMASTPGTKEGESEAEAEVEGLVDESRSLRDGNQQQSERTSGDDSPMSIDKPDSGDVTMDMAVVDDSLSEESDDEQVDQLDEDDTPSQFRSDGRDYTIYLKSTIIFTMDSLGNRHPKALTRLNQYLQEEAKDKKGVPDPSNALTKKALVPTQPNYCDCGLYLLHFAQTFVSDPEKYKAAIFSPKRASQSDRNTLWLNEQVSTMREQMKDRILLEAAKWKEQKAAKEQKELENDGPSSVNTANQQPAQADESDDEIEVSEVRHVGSSPKKQTRAARLR